MSDLTDYCSTAELANELGIRDDDSDSLLTLAVSAASRQVDEFCGRRFWLDPEVTTRVFVATSPCEVDLLDQPGDAPKVEIGSSAGLIVKVDTTGAGVFEQTLVVGTDFQLGPLNAAADGRPWSCIDALGFGWFPRIGARPGVEITARFGWPAVPDQVRKAAIVQATQLYKSKDAVFGAVALGESGAMFVRANMNPTAKALLAGVARVAVG